jgi:hypothetical protein
MADYISPIFNTGEEVDEALTAGLQSKSALVEIVDGGAKNKLSWSAADKTHNGVTFTVNGDGTVTANGTNDGTNNSFISIKILMTAEIGALAGCILSGAPTNDIGAYISLEERGGSYRTYCRDRGEGVTVPEISTDVNVYIVVPKNAVADNLIFKPMICTAAEWDISEEFQPYRPSYQELYERILALEGGGTASLSMASPQSIEESLDTEESTTEIPEERSDM